MLAKHTVLMVALVLGVLAVSHEAGAQSDRKVWHVGLPLLGEPPPPPKASVRELLATELRNFGYVEGQNLVLDVRWAPTVEALRVAAKDLARLNVDVLLAGNTTVTDAARKATRTIPIVMLFVRDPVGQGFIESLAHPGGNITGVAETQSADIGGKLLELLQQALPQLSRVAVVWSSATVGARFYLDSVQRAAPGLRIGLHLIDMEGAADFDRRFESIRREQIQGAVVLNDPTFWSQRAALLAAVVKHRLATIFGFTEFARQGGLLAYGPNSIDMLRRGAVYIDKIFKGARRSELPVEQPTTLELVINLKTAKALGLSIPQSLLLRADHLIE